MFLEHPGDLLDKSTLMATVWPKTVVDENNLNQHISGLRRVLGERPDEHRFVVTVPDRGYRFVAPVHRVTAGPDAPQSAEPAAAPPQSERPSEPESLLPPPLTETKADALLDDEARALDALEAAYNAHSFGLLFIRTAPEPDSLRSSPRFRDLVRRVGFPPTPDVKN